MYEIRWISVGPHGAKSEGVEARAETREEAERLLAKAKAEFEADRERQPLADTYFEIHEELL